MSNKKQMAKRISRDFKRDVYCLLGLPVDNMTIELTSEYLRSRADEDVSAIWATVNVNWIVQSFRDKEFRSSVLNSDLVTLDGRPLLWLAKLLGYPMTEVVPGSTMIQKIHEDIDTSRKLSIFFLGGDGDVAKVAMEKINGQSSGLEAVGAINPGFGTVEEMSSVAIIDEINNVQPDILLVALGAKKGTAWIEYNRSRLNAKIISHLGATVNFLAGTVRRAPKIFQVTATEWLWRIIQEPKLFSRYLTDGMVFFTIVLKRFVWWMRFLFWEKKYNLEQPDGATIQNEKSHEIELSLGRNLRVTNDDSIRDVFSHCVSSCKNITLDFEKTEFIDGAFVSLLLILKKHQQRNGHKLKLINVSDNIDMLFRFFCVFGLLRCEE